jgi:hypothetical protein
VLSVLRSGTGSSLRKVRSEDESNRWIMETESRLGESSFLQAFKKSSTLLQPSVET